MILALFSYEQNLLLLLNRLFFTEEKISNNLKLNLGNIYFFLLLFLVFVLLFTF